MFENLVQQPADKILALMKLFADDPRSDKIDLGVGVYKDSTGVTPVMRSVKAAEHKIWEDQQSKSYVGLLGDAAYSDAMISLVLGDAVARANISAAATPGGTGAVRQAFELFRMANPGGKVWVSDPTWPNHVSILEYLNIAKATYAYFSENSKGVDFEAMMADLASVGRGDLVLLHGCCHNPTGANLNLTQWQMVVDLLNEKGATPMIDIAYQGFGDGLDLDAQAVRLIAASCPETLIAASCSKNFGIYRERTGLLMAISLDSASQVVTQGSLAFLNRQNYSFPPDHGARIVTTILNDDTLKSDWMAELESMRLGMLAIRESLAAELQRLAGSDRFGFVAEHRGMFSRLGLSTDIVLKLREEHAVYMVGDSRINIAGLNETTVPLLAEAIIKAGG